MGKAKKVRKGIHLRRVGGSSGVDSQKCFPYQESSSSHPIHVLMPEDLVVLRPDFNVGRLDFRSRE